MVDRNHHTPGPDDGVHGDERFDRLGEMDRDPITGLGPCVDQRGGHPGDLVGVLRPGERGGAVRQRLRPTVDAQIVEPPLVDQFCERHRFGLHVTIIPQHGSLT